MHFVKDRLIGVPYVCWKCDSRDSSSYVSTYAYIAKVFGNRRRQFESVHGYVHLCSDCFQESKTDKFMEWKRPAFRMYVEQFIDRYKSNSFEGSVKFDPRDSYRKKVEPEVRTVEKPKVVNNQLEF